MARRVHDRSCEDDLADKEGRGDRELGEVESGVPGTGHAGRIEHGTGGLGSQARPVLGVGRSGLSSDVWPDGQNGLMTFAEREERAYDVTDAWATERLEEMPFHSARRGQRDFQSPFCPRTWGTVRKTGLHYHRRYELIVRASVVKTHEREVHDPARGQGTCSGRNFRRA